MAAANFRGDQAGIFTDISPLQRGIGYWVAGKREKNAKQRYAEESTEMEEREGLMAEFEQDLLRQRRDADRIIASLSRHTDQLEREDPESDDAQRAAERMDADMRQAVALRLDFSQTVNAIQDKLASHEA